MSCEHDPDAPRPLSLSAAEGCRRELSPRQSEHVTGDQFGVDVGRRDAGRGEGVGGAAQQVVSRAGTRGRAPTDRTSLGGTAIPVRIVTILHG
jgi:hypothetical protein